MRRLPGPASSPLCEGVKTPEAPVGLFRGWQRTQTQSSVRTLRSLRQQMDVWFCLMQESSAERHRCVAADPDQTNCAPSRARPGILCFSLDFDLPVGLFRGWQRTQTQSSVRTLRSLRQQMDVWFCLMQESSAERHHCVAADPDQTNCAPSRARPGILCFSLDFDLHRCGLPRSNCVE